MAGIEHVEVGVTAADWGLAETGTLVLLAGPGAPRSLSLLPPVHVALLDASRIVTDLHEAIERLPADLPSAVTFVTGPSRSADIEMSLTVGVHGPGALHVIVVDPRG
jgi:L-lactate dehydrogenase complex protein LldG